MKPVSSRYSAKHWRVAHARGRPRSCEICGTRKAKRYEWATRHGSDGMSPGDYLRLCLRCHRLYDYPGPTKLDLNQIAEIRERYNGHNARSLGAEFGVQRTTIARWTFDLRVRPTEDVLEDIRVRLEEGESRRSIARSHGIDHTTVRRWARAAGLLA